MATQSSQAKSQEQNPTRSSGQGQSSAMQQSQQPMDDLVQYLRNYAKEQPEMAALWCFGIGFVVGWKLKPW